MVQNNLLKPQAIRRNSEKSRSPKRTFEERWAKIDLKDLARQHTKSALDTIMEIMTDEDAPANARLNAAQQLLDRGWGKPTSHNEVSIDVYDRMTNEELILFIKDSLPNMPKTIEHRANDEQEINED